jgi:hypothetical protein
MAARVPGGGLTKGGGCDGGPCRFAGLGSLGTSSGSAIAHGLARPPGAAVAKILWRGTRGGRAGERSALRGGTQARGARCGWWDWRIGRGAAKRSRCEASDRRGVWEWANFWGRRENRARRGRAGSG